MSKTIKPPFKHIANYQKQKHSNCINLVTYQVKVRRQKVYLKIGLHFRADTPHLNKILVHLG